MRELISEDDHIRARVHSWEELLQVRFPACSTAFGRNIETTCVILDLEGLSMTDVWDKANMDFLKRTIALDREYYPEMLHVMYVLRAPWAFRGAWSVIQTFLPPSMVEKIQILGDDYLEVIGRDIDVALLPRWLGGESDLWGQNPGPWQPMLQESHEIGRAMTRASPPVPTPSDPESEPGPAPDGDAEAAEARQAHRAYRKKRLADIQARTQARRDAEGASVAAGPDQEPESRLPSASTRGMEEAEGSKECKKG